jgi:putative Ig domain-containing protein
MGSRFWKVTTACCLTALVIAGAALASGGGGGTTTSSLTFDNDTLGNGTVGVFYAGFITASGGLGSPYEFRVVAGKVPAGLTLAKAYGMQSTVISGTPQTVGTSTFTVEVKAGSGATARKAFTLTIAPTTPVSISDPSDDLNPGTVGVSYIHNLFPSGGAQPYRWVVVAGALPAGLSLTSNGSITGAPTRAGTFSFTVRLTDKFGQQATRTFRITVS